MTHNLRRDVILLGTRSLSMFDIKVFRSSSPTVVEELHKIQSQVFAHPFSIEKIHQRLSSHDFILSIHAYSDGKFVGFKTGYGIEDDVFYSWIGGVVPEFRKSGLGTLLMSKQHEYLRNSSFVTVKTKTQNQFREMLILNLRSGFEITETKIEAGKGLQIYLEKNLLL